MTLRHRSSERSSLAVPLPVDRADESLHASSHVALENELAELRRVLAEVYQLAARAVISGRQMKPSLTRIAAIAGQLSASDPHGNMPAGVDARSAQPGERPGMSWLGL